MELSHWDNTESPEQHWATGRQRWVTRTALLHWDSTESLGYRWVTGRQHSVTGKALSHWEAEFRREYLACGEKSRWFRQIALTKAKLFFAFPDKVYSYLREFAKFGQSVLFVNKEARGGIEIWQQKEAWIYRDTAVPLISFFNIFMVPLKQQLSCFSIFLVPLQ